MVCAEGGETAEERSDDEVRTSQVPERSEGKTKVIRQQYLPFTVCAVVCNIVVFLFTKKRVNLLIHSFSFYVLVFLNLYI